MAFRLLLCCFLTGVMISARAQSDLVTESILDYFSSTNRLQEYENITVEWKMDGPTQVQFNEGLNNLFENNPSLAEVNFSSVIAKDSLLWQAYYYRGICYKQLDKRKKARSCEVETLFKTHILQAWCDNSTTRFHGVCRLYRRGVY